MKVLVLGSGAREHAFAWKLRQSPKCEALYIMPGNGGTSLEGTNIEGSPTNFQTVKEKVLTLDIDLVLVGPEEPLILGIRDFFLADIALKHIPLIGPTEASARLEGSKDFSKKFMARHAIPTASYKTFTKKEGENDLAIGLSYLANHSLPIVIKADGLAAGKGVIICDQHNSAIQVFQDILQDGKFGEAGNKVVIEEFLDGIEMSLFVLTDGNSYKILPEAKDYKKIGVGDTGLNTGGMGSVSPVSFFTEELKDKINERIIIPTLEGMREEGAEYFGFLFIGLMICAGEPYVIEYNVRMGDPETQSVIPRMEGDFLELLIALANKKLDTTKLKIRPEFATTIVSVSGGYPEEYQKGFPIELVNEINTPDIHYFHAGTIMEGGTLKTNGGRVISATALDVVPIISQEKALKATEAIQFKDKFFRPDIGLDLLDFAKK
jgi:phosphoribosylamine---glycine ligase